MPEQPYVPSAADVRAALDAVLAVLQAEVHDGQHGADVDLDVVAAGVAARLRRAAAAPPDTDGAEAIELLRALIERISLLRAGLEPDDAYPYARAFLRGGEDIESAARRLLERVGPGAKK